jgi:hypothetical protein
VNLPFFFTLAQQFTSSTHRLWTLMLFGLNVIVLVLFYFYSVPGQDSANFLFAESYWSWSPIVLCAILFWAINGFNNTKENISHFSNLINFIFIAFLPFLFVLQKNETPPMHNVFGYIFLIPTVIIGAVILSLLYFFVASFKASNVLALLNLCSLFYLFIHSNIYSSLLIRLVFLGILVLMFANIPIKMNTFLIDSFDEIETNEDFIENDDNLMNNNRKKSQNMSGNGEY